MKYVTMLPFLSKEDLKELAYKVISGETKGVRLMLLFPFLDSETLNDIVEKLIEAKKGRELRGALPFISKETVEKIYDAVEKGEIKGIRREMLMPFLDQDQIKKIFDELIKNAKVEDVEEDEDVDINGDDEE